MDIEGVVGDGGVDGGRVDFEENGEKRLLISK